MEWMPGQKLNIYGQLAALPAHSRLLRPPFSALPVLSLAG